jgi:hypothetical protein
VVCPFFCCVTNTGHTTKEYSLNFDLTGQNTKKTGQTTRKKEVSYNGYYRRLPNDLFQFDSGYFQFKINKSNT